ncbi:MAG TPA: polysaccharide deacetylase family protein [Candidatus Cloacimonas acidaminovorans]|nr:MAG: Polysaccharide deacetylase [Bacteroidetes bacterium ADurb.Bin008]HQC08439.1 polysaccharide deacetylase family protein [Candidatus Cloacimonas acidaminovorans]
MKLFPNTVINFHVVHDPIWMEFVLKTLKSLFNMVSAQHIESYYYSGEKLKNACHITFDDGHQSFYYNVFPLLKELRIPATLFVSPKAILNRENFWFQEIGGYNRQIFKKFIKKQININNSRLQKIPLNSFLKNMDLENIWKVIEQYQKQMNTGPTPCVNITSEQLIELHQSGLVTIGAHTMNHPILKNEKDKMASLEIQKSIEGLKILLNADIKYFAYPNGVPGLDFDEREMEVLRENGIALAFSTENKSFNKRNNPLNIPRRGISKGNRIFLIFKLLWGQHWDKLKRTIGGKQENDYRLMLKRMEVLP